MITVIAAVSKEFIIGNKGHLPWHIPSELSFFKSVTSNSVVVMGKNTYDSIGKPLPNRVNIIISRTFCNAYTPSEQKTLGIVAVRTMDEAIDYYRKEYPLLDCFIIGGEKVYMEAMERHIPDRLLLSVVYGEYKGDARFPPIDDHYIFTNSFNHTDRYHVRKYERRKDVIG